MSTLYASLANRLASSIDQGIYQPGDKLPGVRTASKSEGVSPATIIAAYQHLEQEGYIEAKPRSGFYVRLRQQSKLQVPKTSRPSKKPQPVNGQAMVLQLIQSLGDRRICQLGANIPDQNFLPGQQVQQAIIRAMKQTSDWNSSYEAPPGYLPLRQAIAKRMADSGCIMDPENIVITSGCQEAIFLTLKTLTQPGDVVAIESPTYYGLLQVIESLGLKALEIPTDPQTGLSVEALQLALEQWPIRACVTIANFSNPLGALMPPERKKELVKLINQHPQVTLIEDDIYGDLHFSGPRPGLLKSLDQVGNVVYCSSYSKTLTSSLRVGWIASEALHEKLQFQKFVTNCATNSLGQYAVADLLSSGRYERHLKTLRLALAQNVNRILGAVSQHFPASTRITMPAGGMSIWLELEKHVDATVIANRAHRQRISIAPGVIFSSSLEKYSHCLRLNCAVGWTPTVEEALKTLGKMVARF